MSLNYLTIFVFGVLWVYEDFMRKRILSFLLPAVAAAFFWNCTDELAPAENETKQIIPVVSEASFIYVDNNGNTYLINTSGFVSNLNGELVGAADFQNGIIYDSSMNIIAQGVDFMALDHVDPTIIMSTAWVFTADKNYVIYPSGVVTDAAGNIVGNITFILDPATGTNTSIGTITDLAGVPLFENVDVSQLTTYEANVTVPPGSSASFIPTSSQVGPGPGPIPTSSSIDNPFSSAEQPYSSAKSSSSTKSSSSAKSSSSVKSSSSAKSSSSVAAQGCPNIKTKSGGRTGSGFASRYWDCCKPHCSWPEHSGGNYSKQCTNKGKSPNTNWGDGSICSGGQQMTCTSQIPFTIDGCTDMGFAFAAVPAADGGSCGKCYQLTFNGTGKYSNDANIKAIKGKKLIVMVTNVGGDVEQGQFDIMIPGGGYGIFDGCSNAMGWSIPGNSERYGGLLSDCEKSTNYNASKTLSCLKEKCNSSFGSDTEAKQGCMFLAEFMHAAGNPKHDYVEVECPDVLKNKY